MSSGFKMLAPHEAIDDHAYDIEDLVIDLPCISYRKRSLAGTVLPVGCKIRQGWGVVACGIRSKA